MKTIFYRMSLDLDACTYTYICMYNFNHFHRYIFIHTTVPMYSYVYVHMYVGDIDFPQMILYFSSTWIHTFSSQELNQLQFITFNATHISQWFINKNVTLLRICYWYYKIIATSAVYTIVYKLGLELKWLSLGVFPNPWISTNKVLIHSLLTIDSITDLSNATKICSTYFKIKLMQFIYQSKSSRTMLW